MNVKLNHFGLHIYCLKIFNFAIFCHAFKGKFNLELFKEPGLWLFQISHQTIQITLLKRFWSSLSSWWVWDVVKIVVEPTVIVEVQIVAQNTNIVALETTIAIQVDSLLTILKIRTSSSMNYDLHFPALSWIILHRFYVVDDLIILIWSTNNQTFLKFLYILFRVFDWRRWICWWWPITQSRRRGYKSRKRRCLFARMWETPTVQVTIQSCILFNFSIIIRLSDFFRWYTYDLTSRICYLKSSRGYQRTSSRRKIVLSGSITNDGCGMSKIFLLFLSEMFHVRWILSECKVKGSQN